MILSSGGFPFIEAGAGVMVQFAELADFLNQAGISFSTNGVERDFKAASSFREQKEDTVTWSKHTRIDPEKIECAVLVLPREAQVETQRFSVIRTDNPRFVFSAIIDRFFNHRIFQHSLSSRAAIGQNVRLGANVHLGDFSSIGNNCSIGDNTVIHPNVTVYDGCVIGSNVVLHAGCVIGKDGFGIVEDRQGNQRQFPQLGNVVVRDNVQIGANSCVDRATMDSTVIGPFTVISNQCQIAHNVIVGSNCTITGKVQINGSAIIGDRVYIGPSSVISNKLRIGNNATIKIGSVVIRDVADGECVSGHFAMPHALHLQHYLKLLA